MGKDDLNERLRDKVYEKHQKAKRLGGYLYGIGALLGGTTLITGLSGEGWTSLVLGIGTALTLSVGFILRKGPFDQEMFDHYNVGAQRDERIN